MLDLLIDLDNTVYPENTNIFKQIDFKMKSFISKNLKVTLDEAYTIQKKYFINNGTTLRGLMIYHDIQPELFLNYVHDIDLSNIKNNNLLNKLLKNYKGKKIIFTNGSYNHANNVLKKIGLSKNIDHIFDIIEAAYIPKPDIRTYQKVIKKYSLQPLTTIMIDDLPNNLKTAKDLGMKTVLIKNHIFNSKAYDYIDIISSDLSDTIQKINKGII
ncbi:MAG: pyrimidine 5'-nucleotidase [Rhodobacteraceae bacterium]|nr:pyrimidine 5'-nucleotidase [Paracoccaceae bacterium]OUU62521.1 MAG: pyrimidine 5'-nucleotidase [Alphaproteobacteria bacterium TMED62]|tara:strand:+ start:4962 stop:5603 length:642 start_codon:yes stop_codon:yes gene_type:complete